MSDYLLPQKPQPPQDSPLAKDRISKNQILLREKLDKIQGKEEDNTLVGDIASAVELGSIIEPIPRDHPYTSREVGEFLEYLEKREKWQEQSINYQHNDNLVIPPFSIVYSMERQNFILVLTHSGNYITSIGVEELENVRGREFRSYSNYLSFVTSEDVDEFVQDIDFDSLQKRLLNAGLTNFVQDISSSS